MTKLHKLKAIVARIADANNYVALVGAPGDPSGADGLTQGQLLQIHEYGTRDGRIPARPIMGESLRRSNVKIVKRARKDVVKIITANKDGRWVMQRLGLFLEGEVKRTFGTEVFMGKRVPNAPETIARKGSSKPLIDTGALRASITSKVVRRGDPEAGGES